jgi:hypothetical protein
MNLTEDQLKQLEILAGLFFSLQDMMLALDIPLYKEQDFKQTVKYEKTHPAFLAYQKGRLTAEIELRQSIKQAALNGSNPAQTTMMDFYNNSKP